MTRRSPVGLRASRFVTPISALQGVLAFIEADIRRGAQDKQNGLEAASRNSAVQRFKASLRPVIHAS